MRFLYNVIVSQLIYAAIFFKNAVFSLFLSWGKGAGLKGDHNTATVVQRFFATLN